MNFPLRINAKVAEVAETQGVEYNDLLDFIVTYRTLPEFQAIIDKYEIEENVNERRILKSNLKRIKADRFRAYFGRNLS